MKLANILESPGAPAVSKLTFEQTDLVQTLLSSVGLGLVVTDGVGGQIVCKSELGIGSTFAVRLPINYNGQTTDTSHTKGSVVERVA